MTKTLKDRKVPTQEFRQALLRVLLYKLIAYLPLIIGVWILLAKPINTQALNASLGLLIAGFTGILKTMVSIKYESFFSWTSRRFKIIQGVTVTLFTWGLSLYSSLHG